MDSRHPVQDLVVRSRERQKPWLAVVKPQRRAGKRDLCKGIVRLSVCDPFRHFLPLIRSHGNAVTRISNGKIDAIDLPRMRHDVETKIEGAAPDVFDLGIAQLRINADHAEAQKLSALADSPIGLREKRSAAAEQHAIVGSEPIVINVVLGIVDLTIARAQFAGQRLRKNFGSDDERPDGNDFLPQRRCSRTRVAAGYNQHVARPNRASRSVEPETRRAGTQFALDVLQSRSLADLGPGTHGSGAESGNVTRGIEAD